MRTFMVTCAAALLAAVPLRAEDEDRPESKADVRVVQTEEGLIIALTPEEKGPTIVRVRATEAKDPPAKDQVIEFRLPEEPEKVVDYRVALVTDPKGGFKVVTAKEKVQVRMEGGKRVWLNLTEVEGTPLRTITTERAILLKPRYEMITIETKEGEEPKEAKKGRLLGFEIVATAPGGEKEEGIARTGKGPETTMEHTRVLIDLPKEAAEEHQSYGVILKPIWKEPGKSVRAFEAVLVTSEDVKVAIEKKEVEEEEEGEEED